MLDPFCGSGTTPLQACLEGRVGVGVDLNPLAHLITEAKLKPPTKDEALDRILELSTNFGGDNIRSVPDDISMLFHESTLEQIVYLKNNLDKNDDIDRFLLACLAGILHGQHHKSGNTSSYLSISMPNTFSMSPNYVRNYIKEKNLKKLPLDAFDNLRHKLDRLYEDDLPANRGKAYLADVRDLPSIQNQYFEKNSVKLVVCSPPYINIIKYGKYNWIRLWLLDIDPKKVDQCLSDAYSRRNYGEFFLTFLHSIESVLADNGVAAIVVGDIGKRNEERHTKLANVLWEEVAPHTQFKLASIIEDKLPTENKVSRIWGDEKKGQATQIDRVLVLYKDKFPEANRDRLQEFLGQNQAVDGNA